MKPGEYHQQHIDAQALTHELLRSLIEAVGAQRQALLLAADAHRRVQAETLTAFAQMLETDAALTVEQLDDAPSPDVRALDERRHYIRNAALEIYAHKTGINISEAIEQAGILWAALEEYLSERADQKCSS